MGMHDAGHNNVLHQCRMLIVDDGHANNCTHVHDILVCDAHGNEGEMRA